MSARSLACALASVSVFLWTTGASADPSLELQAMAGPQGEQVRGSTNFMRMTENGRFILFTNAFGAPGNPQYLHLRDLKSGETVRVSDRTVASGGHYGATADGQYVAYHADLPGGGSALEVKDMSTGAVRSVATLRGPGRVALARSGAIVYVNGSRIVLDDFFAPAPRVLSAGVGDVVRVSGMSEDGTKIVFLARDSTVTEPVNDPADRTHFFQAYLYDVRTQTRTALSINEQDGSLRHMHTLNAAINAQGTHVAILYVSPHHTVSTFDVLDLGTGADLPLEPAYTNFTPPRMLRPSR